MEDADRLSVVAHPSKYMEIQFMDEEGKGWAKGIIDQAEITEDLGDDLYQGIVNYIYINCVNNN